ncbi:MAG: hypothetical protein RI955_778 [Bacteroidota bacterium]
MHQQLKNWLLNNATILKTILLFVGLFYFNTAYTQTNLVPNGSFEILDTCPYAASQLYFAKPWYAPQNNSTDIFSTCASIRNSVPCFSTLLCNSYFQYPKSGNTFGGLYTLNGGNYKEYMQIELLDSLKNGSCYFVVFYVNLVNSSKFSSNGLGGYLSNKPDTQMLFYNGTDPTILPYHPQILKKGNPIITDTLRWTPISGIYISNGTENYLTIGCFTPDSLLNISISNMFGFGAAYYNIDDVSVIEATPQNMEHELALHDTTITEGSIIKIGEDEITGIQYAWYVNGNFIDTTGIITIHPATQTTYIRQMIWCGYTWNDTVVVSVSTGVEQLLNNNEKLLVYPNPCSSNLVIGNLKLDIGYLTITDVLGRVLKQITNLKYPITNIQVEDLPSGIYFIKATDTK